METRNEELLSPRELQRSMKSHLERLGRGEVEKLVVMKNGHFAFVVIPATEYERLTNGSHPGTT